jgi:hypothetical protein
MRSLKRNTSLPGKCRTFHHGGVSLTGPASQSPGREHAKGLILSSGPVALDIRPLSDYQQTLIDTILSLRSRGWSARQTANHFNETGYLTPRGARWLPQSVYSTRVKYEARLVILGGTW